MKKLIIPLLLSTLLLTACSLTSETPVDDETTPTTAKISGANFLAEKGIIYNWSEEPENYLFHESIVRSEVISMVLAMNGVKRNANCRGDYIDVPKGDDSIVCRDIETAADHDYIKDRSDFSRSRRTIRPYDPVTRAEALGILMKALPDDGAWAGYSYYWNANLPEDGDNTGYKDIYAFEAEWQARAFYDYIRKVLRDDAALHEMPRATSIATRGETYDFAKKIMDYREKNGR